MSPKNSRKEKKQMGKETDVSARANALEALRKASEAAGDAMIAAEEKFPEADLSEMMNKRDEVKGSYLDSLQKSIQETDPLFETMVENLENEASDVREKAKCLKDVIEAINLLADLVRLAADLAKVFV